MKAQLSEEHVSAINRDRLVVLNFDAFPAVMKLDSIDVEQMKSALFEFMDDPRTRMDSIWWCFTEGNEADWPSRVLPRIDAAPFKEWADKVGDGTYIVPGLEPALAELTTIDRAREFSDREFETRSGFGERLPRGGSDNNEILPQDELIEDFLP